QSEGVIRNTLWFRNVAILLGGEKNMQAGDYYLPYPQNVYIIASRIVRGYYDIERVKITIPEGFTVRKISSMFDDRFTLFDHGIFEATAPEGYMFPDTYFIGVNATASSTIKIMRENFNKRLLPLTGEIEEFGKPLGDVIIMASILEGEAKTNEDKRIISGILWKRLKLGIPLQVDTSFVYIIGKSTAELTLNDLKINSPYNSYLYKGLPPTPISNPGLDSIRAAITPTTTPYLYFLTDGEGNMHYSKTFNEHKIKKDKYLR
ncbi:MAG: endolytic transglycosylase MltG, partial [Parcubacteria group bacterium]